MIFLISGLQLFKVLLIYQSHVFLLIVMNYSDFLVEKIYCTLVIENNYVFNFY